MGLLKFLKVVKTVMDLDETKQQNSASVEIKKNLQDDAKVAVQKPVSERITKSSSKPKSADYDWNKLLNGTSVEIPEGVTEIPFEIPEEQLREYSDAFENIKNSTSIVFPSTLVKIGDFAFNSWSQLSSVDFSKCGDLVTIGRFAFSSCKLDNHKLASFQNHLFVLPEYLDSYKAQLKAEGVSEQYLSIDVIPEELRYYYDN